MDVAHLMIVLSLLADGGMSAAFVNTDNLAHCEQRGKTLRTILTKGGVDVREVACVPSALQFEPFSHGAAPSAPRHAYLVEFQHDTVSVAPIMDIIECESVVAHTAAPPSMRRLCVTSTQALNGSAGGGGGEEQIDEILKEDAMISPVQGGVH